MPIYSVVIPAYNAAATVEAAVRSVTAQTVAPAEIIVVDDGSSDDTAAIVGRLAGPLKLLRQANAGPGSATTRGFAAAAAPFIATLDADDLWSADKIERQLRHIERHPAVAGVFTHWRTFRDGRPDDPDEPAVPGWCRSTMMVRREVIETTGPVVDPPGRRGEMIDWIARAREAGFVLDMLDDALALRRIRPGSLAFGRDPERDKGYLHVARLALQRRARKAHGPADEG
jgi:glycosyltransferase involved in cell wall biosynthesis